MAKPKVLIADSRYDSYDEEMAVLREIEADVVTEASDDEDKIALLVGDVDAVLVNLAPMTARVISSMKRCRCISRYGTGVDNVDVTAATEKKIVVTNVRGYCAEEVSDHALALLMACARKTTLIDRHVRAGKWDVTAKKPIHRMAGKVLGLVGYGIIGRRLHEKVSGFRFSEVLVHDPFVPSDQIEKAGGKGVGLDELLTRADYISVHAPLTESTRHAIGAEQFRLMKPTAILVNTSRGPLVDPEALYAALKSGQIDSAGIDVYEPEPPEPGCRLFELDNIVLTDHTGWYSEESQIDLQRDAARNVALVLSGSAPLSCANCAMLRMRWGRTWP